MYRISASFLAIGLLGCSTPESDYRQAETGVGTPRGDATFRAQAEPNPRDVAGSRIDRREGARPYGRNQPVDAAAAARDEARREGTQAISAMGGEMDRRQLTTASQFIGREVVGQGGQPLGIIEDVGLDLATGRVEYVVLGTQGPDLGEKKVALPASALIPMSGREELLLRADRNALAQAEPFDETSSQFNRAAWGARESSAETALSPMDVADSPQDRALAVQIRQALRSNDALAASEKYVKITVRDGNVIVRGAVATPEVKEKMTQEIRQVKGVGEFDNRIEVKGN